MSTYDVYRAMHDQAFLPIFCMDAFPSKKQVEACVQAGCRVIEYTQRKSDTPDMLPWIRQTFPELYVLVGSTIDDDGVTRHMRRRHPHLLTIDELADLDVHGFISMLGYTEATIRRFTETHVLAPTAMTVTEALQQTAWGAHMQKMMGSDLDFVKRARGGATFGYCPILVTGGRTPAAMQETYAAGAVMTASGFDLILKGREHDLSVKAIATAVREYLEAAQAAQATAWPELAAVRGADRETWLHALPHYHPFH